MRFTTAILGCFLVSCSPVGDSRVDGALTGADSLALLNMVKAREAAMINRDLPTVMAQFDNDATFINGGGYYYGTSDEISRFHQNMFDNDSLTYTYRAGATSIRSIGRNVAVVYYPWEQRWTMRSVVSDTLTETGLMSLIAVKADTAWKWKAVTNQRTKEFFVDLRSHRGLPENRVK
jgi:hypothetical protein